MTVQSFKPTLWEGALIANFHNTSVAFNGRLSAEPTEITAEKIKFNAIGKGNVKDYTAGSISWEELDTTDVDLTFDQQKYFAFKVNDVDKVQMKRELLMDATSEHAAIMGELYDNNFYKTLADGADTKNNVGSTGTKKKAHKLNAYDLIVDLSTALSKAKAPKVNRFVTVNAEFLGLLAKDPRFTPNPKVLANGIVEGQVIAGMEVVACEELPANKIIAHWKKAIGTGMQIDEVEALRLQSDFADGVRGLQKYGAKVLKKEGIAVLHYEIVDTPTVTVEETV